MRKSYGFTLIELLVVIAIIAILAAILFPVFAQAREKARGITCVSNEKQMGLGILMYVQDYDEFYPMSQYGGGSTGTPQVDWYGAIWPYIKNGDHYSSGGYTQAWGSSGIYRCPDFIDPTQGENYGVHLDLFPDHWNGGTLPVSSDAVVQTPSDKIMIMEKGRNGATWSYPYFITWEWNWVSYVGNPVTHDGSGISNTYDCDYTGDNNSVWAGCGMQPRYRHSGMTNVAFLDGHVKAMPKGSILWYKNIYIDTGQAAIWTGQGWYPY